MKVENKKVKLPVSLRDLIEITKPMERGVTMRQEGRWLVFENAPAQREFVEADGCDLTQEKGE